MGGEEEFLSLDFLLFSCLMQYLSFAYRFSFKKLIYPQIASYTKYFVLIFSMDVVSTLSNGRIFTLTLQYFNHRRVRVSRCWVVGTQI